METTSNETTHRLGTASAGTLKKVTDGGQAMAAEELLAVLLHDLRSPLGAIGVLADLISAATEKDQVPEQRQMALMQEAVTKAQRVLDDAVEIQSLLRGHSNITPVVIEASTIVRNSLEKASHASYFRHVQVEYNEENENQLVRVDFEKAETAMLCALEQAVRHHDGPSLVRIYYTVHRPYINVHVVNERAQLHESPGIDRTGGTSLRGRLGNRKLGESRYNLELCSRVMALMGGKLEFSAGDFGRIIVLQLPMVRD